MKFGQLIEHNKIDIFLQILCRKWDRETTSRPLFIFKKSLKWDESKWFSALALNFPYNKNKLYKTLDYWSRDMLNFNFPEKGLRLVSPPHCVWFFKKNFYHVTFYKLTKFHCLIAFTSRDTGKYVYYSCLLNNLWRHKIWN